ncbi:hypothetical protein CDAR_569951 [Caerostris darwini]|uniref:Uncharacterized protein n=1 Tax=Caerostris darwini TaxID=1538125 RepID=A0AAV4RZS3_9ARAC|nr:hypothetical protein CDAR_569951 [Caerostris darwini]
MAFKPAFVSHYLFRAGDFYCLFRSPWRSQVSVNDILLRIVAKSLLFRTSKALPPPPPAPPLKLLKRFLLIKKSLSPLVTTQHYRTSHTLSRKADRRLCLPLLAMACWLSSIRARGAPSGLLTKDHCNFNGTHTSLVFHQPRDHCNFNGTHTSLVFHQPRDHCNFNGTHPSLVFHQPRDHCNFNGTHPSLVFHQPRDHCNFNGTHPSLVFHQPRDHCNFNGTHPSLVFHSA